MAIVMPIHINSPDTWSMVLSVGQARGHHIFKMIVCFNQELGDIPNFSEILFCDIFPGGVKQAVEC